MELIKQLIPTTPLYSPLISHHLPTSTTTKPTNKQSSPTTFHKYNTRDTRRYDEAKLPRVQEANIVYKGTIINFNTIFPQQECYKHRKEWQLPRVKLEFNNTTETQDQVGGVPIKLQAQWMANAVIDEKIGAALEYRHLLKDPKYKDLWKGGM